MKNYPFTLSCLCLAFILSVTGCNKTNPSVPENKSSAPLQAERKSMTEYGLLNDTTSGRISIDDAKRLALARVPGATDEHIRIRGGYDNGIVLYEGEIIFNHNEYDFTINGYTSEFTDWEVEPVHR